MASALDTFGPAASPCTRPTNLASYVALIDHIRANLFWARRKQFDYRRDENHRSFSYLSVREIRFSTSSAKDVLPISTASTEGHDGTPNGIL